MAPLGIDSPKSDPEVSRGTTAFRTAIFSAHSDGRHNPMNEPPKLDVEVLIAKAAAALNSEDAMRFSQAAFNVANALCALKAVQGK